jgi:dGTPase
LINDAVKVFIDNEAILKFPFALTDKSKYKAQMDDIISISVNNIYQSREVIEKEIVGYQIIQTSWINSLRLTTTSIMEMPLIMTH